MNRWAKFFACALLAAVVTGTGVSASAMNITGVSQAMTVGSKTVTASDEKGDKVKFVSDGKILRLMSADGTKDFLSFNSFDGIYSGVDYSVRAIETTDPTMRLFEIAAWATTLAGPGQPMYPGTALPIWASVPTVGMTSRPRLKISSL